MAFFRRTTFIILLCTTIFLSFCIHTAEADSDDRSTSSSTVVTVEEAAAVDANPLMSAMSPKQQTRVTKLHEGIKKHGCRLKLCFLLEASRFVRGDAYLAQKNFADLIVAITTTDAADDPSRAARLCGATYARNVRRFVPHLVTNRTTFLRRLHHARRPRWGFRGTAHAGRALRFALNRFNTARKAKAAKIVLFGNARRLRTRLHRSYNLPREMRRFKRRGGTVCGVSLNQSTAPELRRVLGDDTLVAPMDGFFDISEIIVATVASLCEVQCTEDDEKDGKDGEEKELTEKEKKDMCPKESVMDAKLMPGSTEENEDEEEEEGKGGSGPGNTGGGSGTGGTGDTGGTKSTDTTTSSSTTGSTGGGDKMSLDMADLVAASQEFEDDEDDEISATPSE